MLSRNSAFTCSRDGQRQDDPDERSGDVPQHDAVGHRKRNHAHAQKAEAGCGSIQHQWAPRDMNMAAILARGVVLAAWTVTVWPASSAGRMGFGRDGIVSGSADCSTTWQSHWTGAVMPTVPNTFHPQPPLLCCCPTMTSGRGRRRGRSQ